MPDLTTNPTSDPTSDPTPTPMPIPAGPFPRGDAIDAITLDLDDTLWPVLPALLRAEATMRNWLAETAPATIARFPGPQMQALRLEVLAEQPQRSHDLPWLRRETLRRALAAAGDDPALAEAAFHVFSRERSRVDLYEDVRPVLARWRERYPLIVITNGNADVDAIGLGDVFQARFAAHEIGYGKPDPRIFHAACRHVGVEPARVLHLGDDLALDLAGARRAGLHAAWIRRPDLHQGGPRHAWAAPPAMAPSGEPVFEDLEAVDRALMASA